MKTKSFIQLSGFGWNISLRIGKLGNVKARSHIKTNLLKINKVKMMKKKCVEYKGGKCVKCGLETNYYEVYDFHHLDPTKKEKRISSLCHLPWESIKEELDKTVLMCANCHRIISTGGN